MKFSTLSQLRKEGGSMKEIAFPNSHVKLKAMRTAFFLLLLAATCATTRAERPNVLIMIADDLAWGDLSANGNRDVETPHIDSLIGEGLKFDKFYTTPSGASSSASLLTGRYHYRTGCVGDAGPEAMMYGSEKTLGDIFGENDYRTGWFGRWHHGDNWPHNAAGQGFQFTGPDIAAAIPFLETKSPEPFMGIVLLPAPRVENGEKLSADERSRKVNEGIAFVDQKVGQLLELLKTAEQRKNTIVLFLSDNGPDQFGGTEGRYNGYFYGGKGSVHEGGIRVPCYVSWPGKIQEGSRFTRITSLIDWYPTFVELCELESETRQLPIDGKSLAPVLRNAGNSENWPNRIHFTSWTPEGYAVKEASVSVRTDRWLALRDPRWRRDKTILESRSGWELYDLKTDPFQSRDLGDEYPFLLSELKADYAFWIDHTTDDGIGPISTHIGHPEWPTVTLRPNQKMTWPIRVVTDGTYQIEAVFDDGTKPCEILVGNATYRLPGDHTIELNGDITDIKVTSGKVTTLKITSLLQKSE